MSLAVITLSAPGWVVARHIARRLPACTCYVHRSVDVEAADPEQAATAPWVRFERVVALTADVFARVRGLIFVAPCGVATRAIAPLLQHKCRDPAVLVVDIGHRHVISLLCGHEGGANQLAVEVANALDAEPVITTSSEAAKTVVAGIGCRRGVSADQILDALDGALFLTGLRRADVRLLATVAHKHDEAGLLQAAETLQVPLRLIDAETIRSAELRCAESKLVRETFDIPAVAEPSALLAGRRPRLILPKTVFHGVTVALAQERCLWSASAQAVGSTAPVVQSKPSPTPTSSSGTCAMSS
jgi:cobalt-precorrin 5A hydrolase